MSYVNYQDGATALAIRVGGTEIVTAAREIKNIPTIQTSGSVGIGQAPNANNPLGITGNTVGSLISGIQNGTGDLAVLLAGATERFRITNAGVVQMHAGQLKFPATQNPSADVNTLDDYEEGTWTPAFAPQGGGSITPSAAAGSYVKVGRMVTAYGLIVVSSVAAPSGELRMTGLPFFSGTGTEFGATGAVRAGALAAGATSMIQAWMRNATDYIVFNRYAAGSESELAGDIQAGSFLQTTITYFAA